MKATKAEALRWLASHVGSVVDTVQVRPNGVTWTPGPRMLARKGQRFTLDGSTVGIHSVSSVDATTLVVVWTYEDGTVIHTTTYRVIGGVS